MVKSYLRYEHAQTFGVVVSTTSNAVWAAEPAAAVAGASKNTGAGRAVVAANERVLTWDIKKGELLGEWRDAKCAAEVSAIAQSQSDADIFAVGYTDGSIRLWDSKTGTVVISFNGHRSAVSALAFNTSGTQLASGGRDAHIIVWDLIEEVGLYRLRGHKDQVTALEFVAEPTAEEEGATVPSDDGWLLSTGKDTFIKLWDLSTQHCVETHIAHHGECWTMALSPAKDICITAGNDGEMKVWGIDAAGFSRRTTAGTDCIVARGSLYRTTKDRAVTAAFHPKGNFVAVHGADKNVEIWRFRSEDEVRRALKRKRKRKAAKGEAVPDDATTTDDIATAEIQDIFVHHVTVHAGAKVRSIAWAAKGRESVQLLVACTNNALEYYDIEKATKKAELPEYNRVHAVELPGHRADIRALSLSSDDRMLASASQGLLKVWNVRTSACIRTFECGYAIDCAFLPGDKIVVVGTKTGELELFDVASSSMLERIKAHEGGVWSLHMHPDGRSLVSGGADKQARFWNFEIVQEEIPGTKRTTPRLKLVQARVLKVNDDILSVRYSPDGKLLALALLDNTVKVFFSDTLKHFLNLYGHKLPVLSMDISHDSKLIATCSADKNVKIWGLDFGDCHRSFFAHQDSVMSVLFEKNTHHFFSAGKDRLIKHWDGDKFEHIQKLPGHHGEVWALAAGRRSDILVSASHDKSIRIWEQSDEPIFLEEERERELEELYEGTLTASLEEERDGEDAPEAAAPGKQTTETLMAGERILEALELGTADLALVREWRAARESRPDLAPPPRNALYVALGGISAEEHVLGVVQKIKAAHLQDALLVLPFDKAVALLQFVDIWAAREWNMPLTCRILFFLLQVHHRQIVASKTMRGMLDSVRGHLRKALEHQKNEVGFNLAAVRYVKQGVRSEKTREFVDEELFREAEERGKRKRAFANLA